MPRRLNHKLTVERGDDRRRAIFLPVHRRKRAAPAAPEAPCRGGAVWVPVVGRGRRTTPRKSVEAARWRIWSRTKIEAAYRRTDLFEVAASPDGRLGGLSRGARDRPWPAAPGGASASSRPSWRTPRSRVTAPRSPPWRPAPPTPRFRSSRSCSASTPHRRRRTARPPTST